MDRAPRAAALVALLLVFAAALMAGCTQQQSLTVKLSDHPTYGKILTDSEGRSLYVQARDVPNTGAVADLGEVGRFYPPFYAESVVGGDGINITEFGYLTRADGKRQTTYRGWPLYYYINDRAAGDAKSQGANNVTFLAKPDYTLMVRENATRGIYLADTSGAALLVRDGENATRPDPGYLPFRASRIAGPSPLVQAADFAETVGPSGEAQTTYRGQPLYSYGSLERPGAIAGDVNGYHLVILAPGGAFTGVVEAPTPAPSPTDTAGGATAASTTVTTTQTTTTATTRSGYDSYTGGSYTPTPFQTVQISSQGTESATVTATWTPVASVTATPLPTLTTQATTRAPVTSRTTAVRTATATMIKTPATSRPTTRPTTPPTTKPSTVPMPITTPPTTFPVTSATTLPLPFPITTLQAVPAGSNQGGNAS